MASEEETTGSKSRSHAYGDGRDALLAAAVRVVAQKGLRDLTYRAVAKEAGVAHGLVTHHFGTRRELLIQALEYSVANQGPGLLSPESVPGEIKTLFSHSEKVTAERPGPQVFQFEIALESLRNPELRPQLIELYRDYRSSLRDKLADDGLDADDALVHLTFAALEGLIFQQVCGMNDVSTESALQRLRELLLLVKEHGTPSSD